MIASACAGVNFLITAFLMLTLRKPGEIAALHKAIPPLGEG